MNFLRVLAVLAVVVLAMATITEAKPLLRFFGRRRSGGTRSTSSGPANGINSIVGDVYSDVNGDIFSAYPNPLGFVNLG